MPRRRTKSPAGIKAPGGQTGSLGGASTHAACPSNPPTSALDTNTSAVAELDSVQTSANVSKPVKTKGPARGKNSPQVKKGETVRARSVSRNRKAQTKAPPKGNCETAAKSKPAIPCSPQDIVSKQVKRTLGDCKQPFLTKNSIYLEKDLNVEQQRRLSAEFGIIKSTCVVLQRIEDLETPPCTLETAEKTIPKAAKNTARKSFKNRGKRDTAAKGIEAPCSSEARVPKEKAPAVPVATEVVSHAADVPSHTKSVRASSEVHKKAVQQATKNFQVTQNLTAPDFLNDLMGEENFEPDYEDDGNDESDFERCSVHDKTAESTAESEKCDDRINTESYIQCSSQSGDKKQLSEVNANTSSSQHDYGLPSGLDKNISAAEQRKTLFCVLHELSLSQVSSDQTTLATNTRKDLSPSESKIVNNDNPSAVEMPLEKDHQFCESRENPTPAVVMAAASSGKQDLATDDVDHRLNSVLNAHDSEHDSSCSSKSEEIPVLMGSFHGNEDSGGENREPDENPCKKLDNVSEQSTSVTNKQDVHPRQESSAECTKTNPTSRSVDDDPASKSMTKEMEQSTSVKSSGNVNSTNEKTLEVKMPDWITKLVHESKTCRASRRGKSESFSSPNTTSKKADCVKEKKKGTHEPGKRLRSLSADKSDFLIHQRTVDETKLNQSKSKRKNKTSSSPPYSVHQGSEPQSSEVLKKKVKVKELQAPEKKSAKKKKVPTATLR